MRKRANKNIDFELNLLPVISILAVCISLLLLTTVWINVGVFNVSQALGTESDSKSITSTLWLEFENDGSIQMTVKAGDKTKARWTVKGLSNQRADLDRAVEFTARIKKSSPDINTALVMPAPESSYQDLIAVMDSLKKNAIKDIGIAPL
jgi:biopolymer transport protein ExbD